MPEELVVIGRVQRAVGLEGYCTIEVFGSSFENLELPAEILIGESAAGTRLITIDEIDYRPKSVICHFQDVDDRESVEQIRGLLLFIEQKQLPSLNDDEYYHFELKAMEVYSDNGEKIGVVKNVYNFPTIDSVEVLRSNGELLMVPLATDSVSIDKKQKRITVRHEYLAEFL